jgi:hypothetical protein
MDQSADVPVATNPAEWAEGPRPLVEIDVALLDEIPEIKKLTILPRDHSRLHAETRFRNLSAIVVRPTAHERYEIVAGYGRVALARARGCDSILARVVDLTTPQAVAYAIRDAVDSVDTIARLSVVDAIYIARLRAPKKKDYHYVTVVRLSGVSKRTIKRATSCLKVAIPALKARHAAAVAAGSTVAIATGSEIRNDYELVRWATLSNVWTDFTEFVREPRKIHPFYVEHYLPTQGAKEAREYDVDKKQEALAEGRTTAARVKLYSPEVKTVTQTARSSRRALRKFADGAAALPEDAALDTIDRAAVVEMIEAATVAIERGRALLEVHADGMAAQDGE